VRRLLDAVLSVLGAVIAVGAAYTAAWVDNFGPDALAGGWTGTGVQMALWLTAMWIVVFGSVRHAGHWVELMGSFLALGFAFLIAPSAVEASALAARAETTTCTVLSVKEKSRTVRDSEGNTSTEKYFVNDVTCAAGQVTSVNTGRPAGPVGNRITVTYDPKGRFSSRTGTARPDPEQNLLFIGIGLGLGALLRAVSELRGTRRIEFVGVRNEGLERIRFNGVIMTVVLGWFGLFFGLASGVAEVRRGLLRLFGTSERAVEAHWWHWPVDLVTWAIFAAVFAGSVVIYRWLIIRVLGKLRFLDPQGDLQDLVGEAESQTGFSSGGLQFVLGGGGLLRAVLGRRRRRTTRSTDRRP